MILPLLIALPLVGAVILAFLPSDDREDIRGAALVASAVTFIVSCVLWSRFDPAVGQQLSVSYSWFPALGVSLKLSIDGLALLLIMLTTFIMPLTILSSWRSIDDRVKEYHLALLVLESMLIGVFCAQDVLLFYVFWEATLVPMFLLIGIFGGEGRLAATMKFFLYTAAGSLLMLAAIIYVYNAAGSFDYAAMGNAARAMSPDEQYWLAAAFGLAFVIKVPLFPFHNWLPHAHVQAPSAGSVLLAAVMLKMGGYGLMRFALPFFPAGVIALAPLVGKLAVIGVIYGALMALAQTDMKRLIAYSSVSHLALVVLGIVSLQSVEGGFAPTAEGLNGAVYQMLAHGLSTGALFLLVGFIYERRHTRRLAELGGIAKSAPMLAAVFVVTTMASIAVPGTAGFVGEFLILIGAIKANPYLGVPAATGVVLGAAYMLWLVKRVFYGPAEGENSVVEDLNAREWVVLAPFLALMIVMGVCPGPFLSRLAVPIEQIIKSFGG